MLKKLIDVRLQTLKPKYQSFDNIFRDYRFNINLPDELYLYDRACLHLKKENAAIGHSLDTLRQNLRAHNGKVDSAEVDFIAKVDAALKSHKLTIDRSSNYYANVIKLLSVVWETYGRSAELNDKKSLLDYFESSVNHSDDYGILYMGVGQTQYPLWSGSQEEKTTVIESIRTVLFDSVVLKNLEELEESTDTLTITLIKIGLLAKRISEAIEADDYTTRAGCCPTVLGLIRDYLF